MKPWWPDPRVPMVETGALQDGASGTQAFTAATVPQFTIGAGLTPPVKDLCSAEYKVPTPCVFTVSSRSTQPNTRQSLGTALIELKAGSVNIDSDGACGFLVASYGCGASQMRAVFDLRTGSYQFPPLQQLRIGVSCWWSSADSGQFDHSLSVAGNIAPGLHPYCVVPTNTFTYSLGAGVAQDVKIPDGARYLDAWCDDITSFGAGKPTLMLYPQTSGRGGQTFMRDYSTGIWAPPYPTSVMTAGTRGTAGTANAPELYIVSNVDASATVQFTLEL